MHPRGRIRSDLKNASPEEGVFMIDLNASSRMNRQDFYLPANRGQNHIEYGVLFMLDKFCPIDALVVPHDETMNLIA